MHNNEEHITFEDMERYECAVHNLTELNKQFLIEIDNKADTCEVCQDRFHFYFESSDILANFEIDSDYLVEELESVVSERATSLFEKAYKVLKHFSSDSRVSGILNEWMESGQKLMGRIQEISYLSPALATRSVQKNEKSPEVEFTVVLNEEGFFKFELHEEQTIKLKVPIQTNFGISLCVIIMDQDDFEHSEVYPLMVVGEKGITKNITLPKGSYLLCVPTK